MRATSHLLAAAAGLAWGAIALALILAMFRGFMPAYSELFLPVAVLELVATLPFQAAIWALTLLTRSSPQLYEVIAMTLTLGACLGVLVAATIRVIARLRTNAG